jgi:hypothetical protein
MKKLLQEKNSKMVKKKPKGFDWYHYEPYKNEFLFYINPIWPIDTKSEDKINDDEIKEQLKETFSEDYKKDYIYIKDITSRRITVAFKSMKWLKENFLKKPKVSYIFPRTLEWKWKKSLPLIVMKKVPWKTFQKFIEKKFKEFLKENQKTLFKDRFKILKKVNYNWFLYEADLQYNKFIVKMKYTVMLSLASAGSILRKGK